MTGRRLLVGVVVLAAAGAIVFALRDRLSGRAAADPALLASGTVEATEAELGFPATGKIEAIAVREGDRVERGSELARLDESEMLARRREAVAGVAAARALLLELERGTRSEEVAQASAAVEAARTRVSDAERDLERTRTLHEGGAVPREALDKAGLAHELQLRQLQQAEEQLALLEAGPRRERIAAQRAALAQSEASVEAVDAALENMTLVAPFSGLITVRHREPGETVPAGAAVVTLRNPDDRWVRIYVKEDRIGAVRIGAPAEIRSDTFADKAYGGEVRFISSEAEFTPKNVQTREERVRLVFAVEVQITEDPSHDLKPGMPADVALDVRNP
ncbi:MAG: HlyD family secretion protein [Vicinamibacteria bacterium]